MKPEVMCDEGRNPYKAKIIPAERGDCVFLRSLSCFGFEQFAVQKIMLCHARDVINCVKDEAINLTITFYSQLAHRNFPPVADWQ